MAGGLAVFGPSVIPTLLGSQFDPSSMSILPILAFVYVLESFRSYYFSLPFELTKTATYDALVSVTGAFTQIILVTLLAPTYSLLGVSIALLATQILMLGTSVYLSHVLLKFRLPTVRPSLAIALSAVMAIGGGLIWSAWDNGSLYALVLAVAVYGSTHMLAVVAIALSGAKTP